MSYSANSMRYTRATHEGKTPNKRFQRTASRTLSRR